MTFINNIHGEKQLSPIQDHLTLKSFNIALLILLTAVILTGCSRKKNTFVNRNWHAVTAEYNTLYNGNLALQLGIEELNQNYRDNYWQILPVERMEVREAVLAPGEVVNPNFSVAEEKAVKAVQRHSMLLEGSEKNPQIDEAYLLLGKARYYDQRFVPALEAFNYILHKYPLSDNINEARIWREKTYMRLEFDELAIKNLKKILKEDNLDKKDRANAAATLAQAYINVQAQDSALGPIKIAAKLAEDEKEKGRYWFIAGQLYQNLNKPDSADYAFQRVIDLNRKTSRIYLINAQIAKIQNNSNLSSPQKVLVLDQLLEMAQNRENRPFLDKIYYQLADFHYRADSTTLAMDYYNKSLKEAGENPLLQSLNYEALGNINFDAANFEVAGAYYDSTLQKLAQNSREYRIIKKKRENLDDVIYYENLVRTNDSILYVASLPETERLAYFTEFTDKLKEKALSETSAEEQEAVNYFEKKRTGVPGVPMPGNSFYFYNPTTVAYGKQEFERVWGNRSLSDNWRTNSKKAQGVTLGVEAAKDLVETDPQFNPQTYLDRVPKSKSVLDSLKQELNFANYQLGLIYREKFKENQLAARKLEALLENDPAERLVVPAKYNLFKIYSETGEKARAESLRNDIIFQYPESRYAAILKNPGVALSDNNNPTALYEELFKAYEKQHFQEVISEATELINSFSGDEIVPKLELLKVMAEGRLYGFDRYKEGLNYVALNYPQSLEGKKAQELLKTSLPALANSDFENSDTGSSFKLVYKFSDTSRDEAEAFQTLVNKVITDLGYNNLTVSTDVYTPDIKFVVVHGFLDPGTATGFAEMLKKDPEYRVNKNYFYISSSNYGVAQVHKNIETYLNTLNKNP